MRNAPQLFLLFWLLPLLSKAQPSEVYYMRADLDEPWCCGWAPYPDANPNGLNTVFGTGGWNLAFYEYADAATIFSANTCYVFCEGGENHADEMEAFIDANLPLIQNWVNGGGSLFLNAAPNEGDGMDWGFGGGTLWYPYWWAGDVYPDPAAATHPIFTGPYTPLATEYYGTSYAHAIVTGPGMTNLIVDMWDPSMVVLGEVTWGAGHVFMGGMTTASWHYPNAEAVNLRNNMHSYLYSLCGLLLPIPIADFSATLSSEITVDLKWSIDEQEAIAKCLVERSPDGIKWETIREETEAAEDGQWRSTDPFPLPGITYYRIEVVNTAGKASFSGVDAVSMPETRLFYPNPAHDVVYLDLAKTQVQRVYIIDLSGHVFQPETCSNSGNVALNVSDLSPGLYQLVVETGNQTISKTLVKQ